MSMIHVTTSSGSQSQYEESRIHAMREQGLLEEGARYWKEGMSEWRPISEYFGVASTGSLSPPLMPATSHAYTKDPRSLTSFLVFMLWVSLGFEIISILSDLGQMSLLNGVYTDAEAEANDSRQSLIGLGYLGVFIVTGITFLMWVYRANLNCRGFGARGMKFTPGWSVGYYFVPFINLVRPYQSMKEIWQVSHNPNDWEFQPVSALLGWWWALWIISGILGQTVLRMSMGADTVEKLQTSTGIAIFSSVIGIPLCLLVIRIVKTISSKQESVVSGG